MPQESNTAKELAIRFGHAMVANLRHSVGEIRKSGAWMGIEQKPDHVTCSTCGVKSLYDSWGKNNWFCPWCNRPSE